ncbi:MAG: acyltransferase [Pirellulaceae bacterium]|nr:acyltransferase [Pirellulaceae bacterium]
MDLVHSSQQHQRLDVAAPVPASSTQVEHQASIFGWHALRLCEGRVESRWNHALRRASERATPTLRLNLDASLVWKNGEHCSQLDGVRGLAILMVTLYRFVKHVDPESHVLLSIAHRFAPIGERGVDLFFVLSGFLITGILLQTKSKAGYFRNFFIRRSLRIFPLYFTALAFCLWLVPALMLHSDFDLPRSQQGYLWTYLTNIRMAWLNAWCFGPLDHFWSLAVEEHFYLVWPCIVFCLSPKYLLRLSVALILLVGVARTIAATQPAFDLATDVLTIFRFDGLCFGAALAILMHQGISPQRVESIAKWTLPVMIILALIVAAFGKSLLGLPNSLCPALWTVLLGVLLTRTSGHWLSRLLNNHALRWLGKYSYGMYVVQLPLLSLMTPNIVMDGLATFMASRLWINIAFVTIMFSLTAALGFLTYHLLEKHFLQLKQRWA